MTANAPRAYGFTNGSHWRAGLVDQLAPDDDGALSPRACYGLAAERMTTRPASAVAVHRLRGPYWRDAETGGLRWFDEAGRPQGPLGQGPAFAGTSRVVLGDPWMWLFSGDRLSRVEADSFGVDRIFEREDFAADGEAAPVRILDIASGDGAGLWVLADETDGRQAVYGVDACGCVRRLWFVPAEAGPAAELAVVDRGQGVLLLARSGRALLRAQASDGALAWLFDLDDVHAGFTAQRLASDGRDRVALAGDCGGRRCLILLDAAGGLLQPPLRDLFALAAPGAAPDIHDLSVSHGAVWLATGEGLCRIAAAQQPGVAGPGSSGVFLTPPLCSPVTANGRGWLRAELEALLPPGSALEVDIASTDDPALKARADGIAANGRLPAARRLEAIWSLLRREPVSRPFLFTAEDGAERRVAVPLFTTSDRWLWLRLTLRAPAGGTAPRIRSLRALYPDLSLMENLPAIFRRDPAQADDLRRIVGVLETTTQDIDRKIRAGAAQLDPRQAEEPWLDALAAWLGIPWSRALPTDLKRRLLGRAGDLLAGRTRRAGLTAMLEAVAGEGRARVTDFTADYAPLVLGGGGRPAAALPGLLAGSLPGTPSLGGKAVLGRMRLAADPPACDAAESLAPTLLIVIEASPAVRATLAPLLPDLLAQMVPAGLRSVVRWEADGSAGEGADDIVLDGDGPGRLARDAVVGATILAGRGVRLDDFGANIDQPLR